MGRHFERVWHVIEITGSGDSRTHTVPTPEDSSLRGRVRRGDRPKRLVLSTIHCGCAGEVSRAEQHSHGNASTAGSECGNSKRRYN